MPFVYPKRDRRQYPNVDLILGRMNEHFHRCVHCNFYLVVEIDTVEFLHVMDQQNLRVIDENVSKSEVNYATINEEKIFRKKNKTT